VGVALALQRMFLLTTLNDVAYLLNDPRLLRLVEEVVLRFVLFVLLLACISSRAQQSWLTSPLCVMHQSGREKEDIVNIVMICNRRNNPQWKNGLCD
jgi:hypothetical protein